MHAVKTKASVVPAAVVVLTNQAMHLHICVLYIKLFLNQSVVSINHHIY